MTSKRAKEMEWYAIGNHVGMKVGGSHLLLMVVNAGPDTNPSDNNALTDYLVNLHNANLTKRTINHSGAALDAARRN